jgi:hypothetical protein
MLHLHVMQLALTFTVGQAEPTIVATKNGFYASTSNESDIKAEELSENPSFSFVILRSRHRHGKLIERVQ